MSRECYDKTDKFGLFRKNIRKSFHDRKETAMKEFYTIGEISKIFDIPTPTLRYYDSYGLLSPWKTGENGYRYYSKAQFEIISTITFLRSLDTPLERLSEILSGTEPDGILTELDNYSRNIDLKIESLTRLKERALSFRDDILETCLDDSIRLTATPDFYMMCKDFGDKDELDIDEILKAHSWLSEWAKSANIISTITPERLEAGDFHTYEKYGYLSHIPFPSQNSYTSVFPSTLAVTGNMRVASIEHFEADGYYARMMDFIRKNKLKIAAPAIERNVLDLYGGDCCNPIMFFKIYIPVTR